MGAAKKGSKRDKRDAVTPAAGSGGQGDQAGGRATLRDRVLPLAIPKPALVVDGRRGRSGLRAKGEAHQAGNLQAACDGDGPRAITTCNRGRVRRWRVAPGEHHRRPAGKLSG